MIQYQSNIKKKIDNDMTIIEFTKIIRVKYLTLET